MCDPSCGFDPIWPEPCYGPYPFLGQIRRRLKAGKMYTTWDCYKRNGIQDHPPCKVNVGVPRRFWHLLPPTTPVQSCRSPNCSRGCC